MHVTTFGFAFVPLAIALAAFARGWLPALLIFAAVLQATSAIDLPVDGGAFGISPYNVAALLAGVVLVLRFARERSLAFLHQRSRMAVSLLPGYIVVAVAGALTLPLLFEGTPVNLLIEAHGMNRAPVPLVFTISNVVQAANLLVHGVVLLFLLQASAQPDWRPLRLLWGLGFGVALVLGIGLYERAALALEWPSFIRFWMNNPGYIQYHQAKVAGFLRMAAPFSEASYASTFLAASFAGCLAMAAFGRRIWLALGGAVLSAVALLNTLGTTGWVAAGVAAMVIPCWLAVRAFSTGHGSDARLHSRAYVAWALLAIVMLAAGLIWKASPVSAEVQKIMDVAVLKKLEGGSAKVRDRSNDHALVIVRETYGLGVGLGSNRASSFLASLVSNTGIAGALLFLTMLGSILWRYLRAARLSDAQIFVAVALATATLAMSLAIPDLNLPIYWVLIFLGILFCPPAANANLRREPPRRG